MRKTYLVLIAVVVALALVAACGGPEEKKAKFFGKAKELFERGDLVNVDDGDVVLLLNQRFSWREKKLGALGRKR